jgi:hypothetical protein
MLVYLNNCRGRDHVKLFGNDAFYDLYTNGQQAEKAKDICAGQKCIVATAANDKKITFSWFLFSHEEVLPDDTGVICRVLYGKFIKNDTYFKMDAAHTEPYSIFFDINGNFKRQSVIVS